MKYIKLLRKKKKVKKWPLHLLERSQMKKILISTKIRGSGKNGVILKEDLLSLMGSKPSLNKRKATHGPEERIKMTRLRMTIAKRLKEAQNNAAMLTTFNEVDMHEVIQMKNNYKDEFKKKYSTKLGFMSFLLKGMYSFTKKLSSNKC